MATKLAASRIAERKLRDRQGRRAQIISAARRIAELEGWLNVTVRRLTDEIYDSQPVLYTHFGSREGIFDAVAIEGFQELGLAMAKARKRVSRPTATVILDVLRQKCEHKAIPVPTLTLIEPHREAEAT